MKSLNRLAISLFAMFAAAGLLVMCGMLVWSFQVGKDFTGRYETATFHRTFWGCFLVCSGLYLLGCIGLGLKLKLRMAMLGGTAALAAGFALIIFVVPLVDFEGWTGATAYTLIAIEFIGALIVLALAGIKRVLQKIRTRQFPT
jgi:hypothetical protein